jgi:hypothetical protein
MELKILTMSEDTGTEIFEATLMQLKSTYSNPIGQVKISFLQYFAFNYPTKIFFRMFTSFACKLNAGLITYLIISP